MKRRDFLKAIGTGLGVLTLGQLSESHPKRATAAVTTGCRIVVFGADGLGIEAAQELRIQGAPALSSLRPPICSLNGGFSATQPGWATIWSGLPSYYNNAYSNRAYGVMPENTHILSKIIRAYADQGLYLVWITGKGKNILGNVEDSPQYPVYDAIVNQGHAGVYYGDEERENYEVYNLAVSGLQDAVAHDNFIAFVHFHDPDDTGHHLQDHAEYMEAALRVDRYIWGLMKSLTPGTDVIYCSDHGFSFKELGDAENSHRFCPWGTLATDFPVLNVP